jgi:hypothetical protein
MATIVIWHETPRPDQLAELIASCGPVIHLAVDVRREVLAAGAEIHADCEQALLEGGSRHEDVWGADWLPDDHSARFKAQINIRPRQSNFNTEIQDAARRAQVERVIRRVFEGQ